jgi:hypothetical protein
MGRVCIFCSSKKNLNKEDLWPVWLVGLITQDRPCSVERVLGSNGDPFIYGGRWIKGRCVCEECNHGWMSDLETNVKPIISPLICDVPSSLEYVQQLAIATWTLKTAMAFECIKGAANPAKTGKDVFYCSAQRTHLWKWRTPPSDTFVWIGRYEPEFSLWVQNDRVSDSQPRGLLDEGSVTTFGVGRLLIQAITVRRSEQDIQYAIRTDKSTWDEALIPIWPHGRSFIRWPPQRSVSGYDNLMSLARRFGRNPTDTERD